jgi:hypothetical protein
MESLGLILYLEKVIFDDEIEGFRKIHLVVLEQSELILAADDWIEKFG